MSLLSVFARVGLRRGGPACGVALRLARSSRLSRIVRHQRQSQTRRGIRHDILAVRCCGVVLPSWVLRPLCSAVISAERQGDISAALSAWYVGDGVESFGKVALVTLTMRHNKGHSLKALWDALSEAWNLVGSGAGWAADQLAHGERYVKMVVKSSGPRPRPGTLDDHLDVPLTVGQLVSGPASTGPDKVPRFGERIP